MECLSKKVGEKSKENPKRYIHSSISRQGCCQIDGEIIIRNVSSNP